MATSCGSAATVQHLDEVGALAAPEPACESVGGPVGASPVAGDLEQEAGKADVEAHDQMAHTSRHVHPTHRLVLRLGSSVTGQTVDAATWKPVRAGFTFQGSPMDHPQLGVAIGNFSRRPRLRDAP